VINTILRGFLVQILACGIYDLYLSELVIIISSLSLSDRISQSFQIESLRLFLTGPWLLALSSTYASPSSGKSERELSSILVAIK
jgi:hypothetical protein